MYNLLTSSRYAHYIWSSDKSEDYQLHNRMLSSLQKSSIKTTLPKFLIFTEQLDITILFREKLPRLVIFFNVFITLSYIKSLPILSKTPPTETPIIFEIIRFQKFK